MSSKAAGSGTPPKPSPATLLNGEPSPAKLATPPATGRTNPAAPDRRRAASLPRAMSCASTRSIRPAKAMSQKQRHPPAAYPWRGCGCALRRHQVPSAVFACVGMGVAALHGHLISPLGHDHPGPPGPHRGRITEPDPPFFGMPGHLGEPQLPRTDRAEQFLPVCDLAAQHVDDEEIVGQYRAEQL